MTTHDRADGLSQLTELMDDEQGFSDALSPSPLERSARRARRRRALLITVVVIALLVAAVGGYVGWALTAPVSAPVVLSQTPAVEQPAAVALALPAEGAAAISISGGDEYLGAAASGVWASSGTNEARPIASISKLITALVILEARPLAGADDPGPTITFDEAAHDLYDEYYVQGATIARMPTGSSMSQRDALATMLIPSASNYAEAVSTWVFGSQGAFLDATRRWLATHGLASTTIVEPTGISARNTSTPSDLLTVARLAAADPVIAQIVAMPSLTLPGPGVMSNTNVLLGHGGITGLKTGNLGENSYNLLYTATLDVGTPQPLSVTGLALGGQSRDSVNRGVLTLLDSIRAGFHRVPLATRGQDVGTYTTPWGASARMVVGEGATIFTWSDTPISVAMETTTPTTYVDGEQVGSITWSAGPDSVTAGVEIEGAIEPPTAWWRLTHPTELGGP